MTLADLAGRLDCTLLGDGSIEIHSVAGMEQAGDGQLTFLANPRYAHKLKHTRASAVLVREPVDGIACLLSENPYLDFARALALFYQPPRPRPGIDPFARIAKSAVIGDNAYIGPFVSIGEDVRIGRNAVLHPNVAIYQGAIIGDDFYAHSHVAVREFSRIGNRVTLQNGVVIGGDGFGFAKDGEGRHRKIVQSGIVVIEDDVEVQSLSSVDRATVGETRIRRGARIDSLVQIGHACDVGEDAILCGQVGLAGSTVIEKNVLLAGQAGIAGHVTLGENTVVYAQSGVSHNLPAGSVVAGSPCFDAAEWRKASVAFPKLAGILKRMRQLEQRLAALAESGKSEPEI